MHDAWLVIGLAQDELPFGVHTFEALGLHRQLLHDVGRVEDRLEVSPSGLALDPLLQSVGAEHHLVAPGVDFFLVGLLEGRELHGL